MYGGLPGKKPWLVRDQAPLLKYTRTVNVCAMLMIDLHVRHLKIRAIYDWLKYRGMAILVCRNKNRFPHSFSRINQIDEVRTGHSVAFSQGARGTPVTGMLWWSFVSSVRQCVPRYNYLRTILNRFTDL